MMTKRPPSVEAISLLSILLIHYVGLPVLLMPTKQ